MRSLARHLFTLCSAASLLLCVVTCVLWVRSRSTSDALGYFQPCTEQDPRSDYWIHSNSGRLSAITALLGLSDKELGFRWTSEAAHSPYREEAGFAIFAWEVDGYPSYASVSAPHWAVALLLAVPGASWLVVRLTRRHLQRSGCCRVCGYDLRASPDRCPECGVVPEVTA